MGPLAYRVTPPREGGVLFVGDAAGFYDPFTGEGIFTALRSAELAADTLVAVLRAGDVSATAVATYGRARPAAFADKEPVTRALQALIGRPRLAHLAARSAARRATATPRCGSSWPCSARCPPTRCWCWPPTTRRPRISASCRRSGSARGGSGAP